MKLNLESGFKNVIKARATYKAALLNNCCYNYIKCRTYYSS